MQPTRRGSSKESQKKAEKPMHEDEVQQLQKVPRWAISLEVTEIDFMDAETVFVAGSTGDCSKMSPNPTQRGKARRAKQAKP
jgi:hypothetical protein